MDGGQAQMSQRGAPSSAEQIESSSQGGQGETWENHLESLRGLLSGRQLASGDLAALPGPRHATGPGNCPANSRT